MRPVRVARDHGPHAAAGAGRLSREALTPAGPVRFTEQVAR
jgi:hypothetical protein